MQKEAGEEEVEERKLELNLLESKCSLSTLLLSLDLMTWTYPRRDEDSNFRTNLEGHRRTWQELQQISVFEVFLVSSWLVILLLPL